VEDLHLAAGHPGSSPRSLVIQFEPCELFHSLCGRFIRQFTK
jgi:hypothetical protein